MKKKGLLTTDKTWIHRYFPHLPHDTIQVVEYKRENIMSHLFNIWEGENNCPRNIKKGGIL